MESDLTPAGPRSSVRDLFGKFQVQPRFFLAYAEHQEELGRQPSDPPCQTGQVCRQLSANLYRAN
jgi:hypothetical protein